jgi:hypothetical protein
MASFAWRATPDSFLHERQRLRLRAGDKRAWPKMLEALDHSGLDPNDWFPSPPKVGPYPGLVAFDEKDAGVFFGRKQEITEYLGILDTLRGLDRSQVLVISGASGSGKSSLLRAGLIPRLRQKPKWAVISPFEVAREPVRNLQDRLGEALAGLRVSTRGLSLTKPPNDPKSLAQILDKTLRRLEQATGAWVLLPLDQAEALVAGTSQRATRPGYCSMRWRRFLPGEHGMSLLRPLPAPSLCHAWRPLLLDLSATVASTIERDRLTRRDNREASRPVWARAGARALGTHR